jgi:hypothetical protein
LNAKEMVSAMELKNNVKTIEWKNNISVNGIK